MLEQRIPAIIQSLLDWERLEASEALTLRRWFYGDGQAHQDDASALFIANAKLKDRFPAFNALFVELLADYVLNQRAPAGRVDEAKADWLIAQINGGERAGQTAAELDLLVEIITRADRIPASLAAFTLALGRRAAIKGIERKALVHIDPSRKLNATQLDHPGGVVTRRGAAAEPRSRPALRQAHPTARRTDGAPRPRANRSHPAQAARPLTRPDRGAGEPSC